MADPIARFIPSYPDPSDAQFSYELSKKLEFEQLRLGPSESVSKRGELLASQVFAKRFFSPHTSYPHALMYQGLGTGKCIAPGSMIKYSMDQTPTLKEASIADLWDRYASDNAIFDGEGWWALPTAPIFVFSYYEDMQFMTKAPVKRLYRQHVQETMKRVLLASGEEIVVTKAHRLRISRGDEEMWTNGYTIGDYVAVCDGVPVVYIPATRRFSRIVLIQDIPYEGWVYDLEVETHHNYLAEGMLCHNTCLASAVVEASKHTTVGGRPRKPALVFAKSDDLKRNITNEIVSTCTYQEYEARPTDDEIRRGVEMSSEAKTIRINRAIAKSYEIVTYETFLKFVAKQSDEIIRRVYSYRVIILDEAHLIRKQPAASKKEAITEDELAEQYIMMYDELYRFLHLVQGCKILLLTGTPIWDRPSEIASLMNLILPEEDALPTGAEFERTFFDSEGKLKNQDRLRAAFRGKISTLRQMITTAERIEMGTRAPWLEKILVYPDGMSEIQARAAKKAFEEVEEVPKTSKSGKEIKAVAGGTIYKLARDAANMVYPIFDSKGKITGTGYDMETFNRYTTKTIKGTAAKDYGFTDPHLKRELTENLATYSAKFAAIIESLKANPKEVAFIYCEKVTGVGGAISLALLLELHGFEWARRDRDIATVSKKKRFAVITSNPRTTSSSTEVAALLASAGQPDNIYGDRLQIIIGSEKIAMGISIKHVRQYHQVMPHWNISSTDQAENRGYRFGGHDALPKDERYIKIFRHVAVETDPKGKAMGKGFPPTAAFRPTETVDIYVYKIAESKEGKNSQIYRLLKEESFDCPLYYGRNVLETDVAGTKSCDYRECNYKCAQYPDNLIDRSGKVWRYDVPAAEIDHSTYDLFYAGKEVKELVDRICEIFHSYFALHIDELIELLALDGSAEDRVLQALDIIIDSRLLIRDPYGFMAMLKEDGDMIFLDRDISIRSKYAGSVYISAPLVTERVSLDEASEILELKKDMALVKSCSLAKIKDVSYKTLVVLVEAAYTNQKLPLAKEVLETLLARGDVFKMNDGKAVHVMYVEEFTGQAYDVAAKELHPTGLMRVLSDPRKGWEYVSDPKTEEGYIKQIKDQRAHRFQKGFENNPRGIYGWISKKDGKFRISTLENVEGKQCSFKNLRDLVSVYMDDLGYLPPAKPEYLKLARRDLIKLLEGHVAHKSRLRDLDSVSTAKLAQMLTLFGMNIQELCEGLRKWFKDNNLMFVL